MRIKGPEGLTLTENRNKDFRSTR